MPIIQNLIRSVKRRNGNHKMSDFRKVINEKKQTMDLETQSQKRDGRVVLLNYELNQVEQCQSNERKINTEHVL